MKRLYTYDELFPPHSEDKGGVMQIIREKDNDINTVVISANGMAAEMWEGIFEWVAENLIEQRAVAAQRVSGLK